VNFGIVVFVIKLLLLTNVLQQLLSGSNGCREMKITAASTLELHQISAPALANLKSGHFSQIRPSPAPATFLAGFGRHHGRCSAFS